MIKGRSYYAGRTIWICPRRTAEQILFVILIDEELVGPCVFTDSATALRFAHTIIDDEGIPK